ncbi:huntingtin-like isoform X1 [Haliotis cracherodii]|uniref:huntingtin-like isoform X1 n=1 Tax=Haliotis cracherodii TaxID=6455 RepID=UPI0039E9AD00
MATIEKLIKAFEGLKVFQPGGLGTEETTKKKDQPPSKKDKMVNCNIVADCICAPNMRSIADFPKFLGIAMEAFLTLCDDQESDIRMVADECLNRTIKTLLETNLGRLQVELYKEIKKCGPSRSLRGALWRFADMCHLIRPQKCRPYIVNLLPCLARICRRDDEEAVQETLSSSMQKICPGLMGFANDTEVKGLLKAFLPNLKSNSAVCRRTAASSLTLICQYSRCPITFFSYLITILLELVLPVDVEHDVYTLLGVILCMRTIIPQLVQSDTRDQGLKGSFGVIQKEKEEGVNHDQILKMFQLLLFYTNHPDHNVVTAALEAMQQLLRTPPPQLRRLLLASGSIQRTLIYQKDFEERERFRVESSAELPTISDDTGLEEEEGSDVTGQTASSSDTSAFVSDLDPGSVEGLNMRRLSADSRREGKSESDLTDLMAGTDATVVVTSDNDYSNVEIGDLNEEKSERSTLSHSSSVETLLSIKSLSPKRRPSLRKGVSQDLNGNPEYDPLGGSDTPERSSPLPSPLPPGMREDAGNDIGSLLDEELPLLYCVRLLCRGFLLNGSEGGLLPDKVARVSLKSLALSCVASALSLCPKIFLYKLFPRDLESGNQHIREVVLYASHPDPQLKGTTAMVIGSLIKAVLTEGRGDFKKWLKKHSPADIGEVSLERLVETLVHIMCDQSSVAIRLTLIALQLCLSNLLESCHGKVGISVMLDLLDVKNNPYWLVKVELLELLGGINFKVVCFLGTLCKDHKKGCHNFLGRLNLQDHYLSHVIIPLLGDEDGRVRHAASRTLLRLVPKLFFAVDNCQQDPVTAIARDLTDGLLYPLMSEWAEEPPPLVQGLIPPYHFSPTFTIKPHLESSLSRVVQQLLQQLHKAQTKHLTSGCCHAMCLLSEEYLVSCYASSWGCGPATPLIPKDSSSRINMKRPPSRSLSSSSTFSLEELTSGSGGGPLPVILALLLSSPAALDLSTHQDLIQLAGNLLAGSAFKTFRGSDETASLAGSGDEGKWAAVSDRLLVPMIEHLLSHVARVLNACAHVIDEQVPGPPQMKPSLPSLPNAPSLSPVKRKVKGDKESQGGAGAGQAGDAKSDKKTPQKDQKEPEKEKSKKDGLGIFYSLPQYMKVYEMLRGAYSNYKISLDLNSSDKFCNLLKVTLAVFSQILEIATLFDIGKYAEEFLGYLKSTMTMEPTFTVLCVQQLLKALFGTNLANQWESQQSVFHSRKPGKPMRVMTGLKPGIYQCCLNQPYSLMTHSFAGAFLRAANQTDQEESQSSLMWLRKRVERKTPAILKPGSKVDKSAIASYIRLFEPLVIKSLKQYTVTSSLELQRQVLDLLAQLVQLRVNYCLLDSDQIFIGFVLKQFEFIEEGQIRNSEMLVPHIFQFLVMLSYERFHSKSIIDMPRIIHRCDGIMASGLQPTTHAIPALRCVVYDLFLLRGNSKSDVGKELETQREVVVSMLLRLINYYQALEMFVIVLQQCHRESEDKWKRLSRQVIDTVLPALAKQQINIDRQASLDVLHRLFESVAPSVFRPVDILLKGLLGSPGDISCVQGLQRWMCLVLSVMRVLVSQSKEEVVLSRLVDVGLSFPLTRDAGERDTNIEDYSDLIPEEIFAWFLLQAIGKCAETLNKESVTIHSSDNNLHFLVQQMCHLILYITHMFQSGLYRRVATAAMRIMQMDCPRNVYSVREINQLLLALNTVYPTLTMLWCNVLILLNFDDQSMWSQVMHTPQKYLMVSPSRQGNMVDLKKRTLQCCQLELLRRGGLILFCDYVCENLNDAEHMTWLIINHVSDLIELSDESPVQDFISAIHRNSAASSLFIQAIHARCENVSRPSLVKKTLKCIEAIHLTQSGALLTLLIDKFLNTHQLAVARMCDTIACRRVEMLLAENYEDSSKQLPLEDLEKLLQFMRSNGLIQRHARLVSLLNKFLILQSPDNKHAKSPEKTHPLALTPEQVTNIEVNKDFYLSVVKDQCFQMDPNTRECAFLLQRLDYADILSITMTKEFSLAVLEECISLGAYRTLVRYNRDRETHTEQKLPPSEPSLDTLFQAAQLTLFRHINNIINHLPIPHQNLNFRLSLSAKEIRYMERIEDLFTDSTWFVMNFQLTSALTQYLVSVQRFPWKPGVPAESHGDVCRFSVLCMEMLSWLLQHNQLPTTEQIQTCLECVSLVLQNQVFSSVIGQTDHSTWVCTITSALYQLMSSLVVLPGEKVAVLAHQDREDDSMMHSRDESTYLIRACDQISELVHCLQTRLKPKTQTSLPLPPVIAAPIRNIVIGLGRLQLVNTYARTPPLVWKLGWAPSPSGDLKTKLPPLPVDFLQEKEVLREFVLRVNTLGWVSRQQFEETWMSLLALLNPVSGGMDLTHEEEVDRSQVMVISVKAITALLLQSILIPFAGNPGNSMFEVQPRDKPLAFLHTRCGKKLSMIRGLIEQEIQNLCAARPDRQSHHAYAGYRRRTDSLHCDLFEDNLERETGMEDFGQGQISLEAIWSVVGTLETNMSESDTTDSMDSPLQEQVRANIPLSPIKSQERSITLSGLDIHSCLQFLLELYTPWLACDSNSRPPLMLINAVVESIVCLSDLFMEREQFELMLDTLLDVHKTHPSEDELVTQYLNVGICKAVAVVGADSSVAERVVKLIDVGLKSTHLPSKVSTLHGMLYLLEANIADLTKSILPLVTDFLLKHLSAVSNACITSQQFELTMWAVAFYVLENYHDDLRDAEFPSKMLTLAVSTASGSEDSVSTAVFLTIMKGTERLLLTDVLSRGDMETIMKLSMDRLCLPSPQRALAALGLMFTCMYSGKQFDQYSPRPRDEMEPIFSDNGFSFVYQDPESLILAMERVTVLFDRIKKGYPYEARVITRLLPAFLADFFPPQDIMNKVIGEFLSSQQPYPQLIAKVVFQVFNNLHQQNQQSLVRDWVMLSLSNFTQRSPVAMAMWSLTCFFISASTNQWLKALFPHVIGRMGKMETIDRKLFCLSALDFKSQLTEDLHVFVSTFQAVAQPDSPYQDLVNCLT